MVTRGGGGDDSSGPFPPDPVAAATTTITYPPPIRVAVFVFSSRLYMTIHGVTVYWWRRTLGWVGLGVGERTYGGAGY